MDFIVFFNRVFILKDHWRRWRAGSFDGLYDQKRWVKRFETASHCLYGLSFFTKK